MYVVYCQKKSRSLFGAEPYVTYVVTRASRVLDSDVSVWLVPGTYDENDS